MKRLAFGLAVLLASASSGTAHAGLITIGNNAASNSFPFGTIAYTGEYQQIYTNTAFSGPVTISSVAFASVPNSTGIGDSVGFTLSLSTTPLANLASPSTTYSANRGADFTQVFSGTKSFIAQGNGTFDLVIATTPFVYDPSKGALLLDVNITSPDSIGTGLSFEANTDSSTARVYNGGGAGTPTVGKSTDATGLYTQFNVSPLGTVPEPASLAMLALGLAAARAARRR